jgi:hypothetical protein
MTDITAAAPVVDWARAEQVAIKVSGRSPAPDPQIEGWDPPIANLAPPEPWASIPTAA